MVLEPAPNTKTESINDEDVVDEDVEEEGAGAGAGAVGAASFAFNRVFRSSASRIALSMTTRREAFSLLPSFVSFSNDK